MNPLGTAPGHPLDLSGGKMDTQHEKISVQKDAIDFILSPGILGVHTSISGRVREFNPIHRFIHLTVNDTIHHWIG